MRYSDSKPLQVTELDETIDSNAELLRRCTRGMKGTWAGAILLAGGNDWRSMVMRRAQASLRFDRRPSYWSHAALILEWNAAQPEQSWGVEVSFEPQPPFGHLPEHNAVTPFRVERYLDDSRWVNLCVAPIVVAEKKRATQVASAMREAALEPHRRGVRYPLWTWLAAWTRYSYLGDGGPSPLEENVPMPAAGLVEMALDAAEISAAPGATDMDTSPETLWSTIRHWHDRIGEGVKIAAWRRVRDELGTVAKAKPLAIDASAMEGTGRKKRAR